MPAFFVPPTRVFARKLIYHKKMATDHPTFTAIPIQVDQDTCSIQNEPAEARLRADSRQPVCRAIKASPSRLRHAGASSRKPGQTCIWRVFHRPVQATEGRQPPQTIAHRPPHQLRQKRLGIYPLPVTKLI